MMDDELADSAPARRYRCHFAIGKSIICNKTAVFGGLANLESSYEVLLRIDPKNSEGRAVELQVVSTRPDSEDDEGEPVCIYWDPDTDAHGDNMLQWHSIREYEDAHPAFLHGLTTDLQQQLMQKRERLLVFTLLNRKSTNTLGDRLKWPKLPHQVLKTIFDFDNLGPNLTIWLEASFDEDVIKFWRPLYPRFIASSQSSRRFSEYMDSRRKPNLSLDTTPKIEDFKSGSMITERVVSRPNANIAWNVRPLDHRLYDWGRPKPSLGVRGLLSCSCEAARVLH